MKEKSASSNLSQTGGVNAQGHRLGQDVEQNHRAVFCICVLVDGFKPGKWTIGDGDVVAHGEQGLRMGPLLT